jgi:hypothetical protein
VSNSSPNSADHPRTSHRSTTSVGKFADVDGARDVSVSMAEQECDFVDAFAGEQRSACHRVAKAVHGRERSVRDVDRTSALVGLMQDREGRIARRIHCMLLRESECPPDIALP